MALYRISDLAEHFECTYCASLAGIGHAQVLFEGCEDYDADVLQQLGPYPEVCFRFLRRVAGLSPDTGMKISSKVRHKFRPKTVVQLLELLCQFEPMQVRGGS